MTQHTNRLIHEKSPYLLQHAHNPVDWFPWGDEAFRAAREFDKPIFLSIGYATCHWCHVMEKESFENDDIAQMMNDAFINIKVDREELPEVDSLYMEFAQSMMAGSAGWPLNVILTPELKPFFAATYLPPKSSHGMMGVDDLIHRIHEVWNGDERDKIEEQAEKIVEVFEDNVQPQGEQLPSKELVEEAAELLFKMADPVYGGMKGTPKFPIGYQSNFMLHHASEKNDSRGIFLVEKTLDMMHRGGIYDHLGGGFSRYSVDEQWLVPHFEKMLYDNAILAHSYLEAWQLTKRPLYREICIEILNYILRDMTDPEGGFYTAEDADSEGHEGLFYTWSIEEVENLLDTDADLAIAFFGMTEYGNFEGRNILHTSVPLEEFAAQRKEGVKVLIERIATIKQKLWKAREKRVHPFKDDKILSSWNGLVIHTLARAGSAFQEPKFVEAALNAAQFIQDKMWKGNKLYRRWRDGDASFSAGLDEYAYLIRGVLALYEANGDAQWLSWCLDMTDILEGQFKAMDGAFYQTDGTDANIILQRCQFSDGAEPSGNAIHGENLLRLNQITYNPNYLRQAEDVLKAAKNFIETYPPGYCYHIINLNRYFDVKSPTIIVSLNQKEEHRVEIEKSIFESFIPHKTVIWRTEKDDFLFSILPHLRDNTPIDGKTTLYICNNRVCARPLNNLEEMKAAILKL
jgi:uncharacterized protein YyaL (SSP411 family)